jgi:hypothetical protein
MRTGKERRGFVFVHVKESWQGTAILKRNRSANASRRKRKRDGCEFPFLCLIFFLFSYRDEAGNKESSHFGYLGAQGCREVKGAR